MARATPAASLWSKTASSVLTSCRVISPAEEHSITLSWASSGDFSADSASTPRRPAIQASRC